LPVDAYAVGLLQAPQFVHPTNPAAAYIGQAQRLRAVDRGTAPLSTRTRPNT